MNTRIEPAQGSLYLADTHEVTNLSRELTDYNMYTEDAALQEAVRREGGQWAEPELAEFGKLTGSADYLELGNLANRTEDHIIMVIFTHRNTRIRQVRNRHHHFVELGLDLMQALIQRGNLIPNRAHGIDLGLPVGGILRTPNILGHPVPLGF